MCVELAGTDTDGDEEDEDEEEEEGRGWARGGVGLDEARAKVRRDVKMLRRRIVGWR